MYLQTDKTRNHKHHRNTNPASQRRRAGESTFQFADDRPANTAHIKTQEIVNKSPQAKQTAQLQSMADEFASQQSHTVHNAERPIQRVKTVISADLNEREEDDDYQLLPSENLKHDPEKRALLDTFFHQRQQPTPEVGISNRPGLGFDASVFTKGAEDIEPTSLPHGFEPQAYVPKSSPDYEKSLEQAATEKNRVQGARKPENAASDLSAVDGLFIPGGQDRDSEGSNEQTTRHAYEQALVKEARSIGMPTLAVCGGSRAFAKAFGAQETRLSKSQRRIHKQKTSSQAHGLSFPEPHSILGGASPTPGTLDQINSTHEKIADLSTVDMLPTSSIGIDTPEQELRVTATDEANNPEGFETRYGAPMVGVTSHPEAIYRGSGDRAAATSDAQEWSDNIFKAYQQSMQTYANKKQVNAELRSRSQPEGFEEIGESVDLHALHTEGFMQSKLGNSLAKRNRQAKPDVYKKWLSKRNWQKLLSLRMITPEEAETIRQEVLAHKAAKKEYFLAGRPGHEPPERY